MQRALPLLLALAACGSSGSPLETDPPVVLWSAAVFEPSAGPVVVGDRLLIVHRDTLFALQPLTGTRVWSVALGAVGQGVFPALTAAGGVAYASQERMVAVRIEDGAIIWSRTSAGPGILAPDAGRLYVVPGTILALDAGSGEFLWETSTPTIFGQVAVGGGLICVGGEAVVCHDGTDGQVLWSAIPPGDARVIDLDMGTGRLVASTTRGDVVAYDPLSGTVVWSRNVGTPLLATTVAGLRVYSCRGGSDPDDLGLCYALEESNGSVRWVFAVRGSATAPLVRDGLMLVVDVRAIHVVDVATGRVVRRIAQPPGALFHEARLAYAGGILYVSDRGGLGAFPIQ